MRGWSPRRSTSPATEVVPSTGQRCPASGAGRAGRGASSTTTSSSRTSPGHRSRSAGAPPGRSTITPPPSVVGSSRETAYTGLRLFRRGGLDNPDVAVTASNRAGQVYRLSLGAEPVRALAERLDGHEAVDVALFVEDGDAVARREREELRFRRGGDGWHT